MKKLRFLFIFFCVVISTNLSSCSLKNISKNQLQKIGVFEIDVSIKQFDYDQKQIVILKTRHIGKKEYYNQMQIKIDSLKTENCYFFLEGIRNQSKDTTQQMKYRKIVGNMYTNNPEEVIDTINKKIYGFLPYDKEWNLMTQPTYEEFGLDSLNSKVVDVDVTELVNLYEDKFQKIELDSCDYSTSFNDKYECPRKTERKNRDEFFSDYLIIYRDKNVANKIKESKKTKICIMYGQKHYEGIKSNLENSSETN